VVIRGLHTETYPCNIKSELSEVGHFVHNIVNIQIKKKKKSTLTTSLVIELL